MSAMSNESEGVRTIIGELYGVEEVDDLLLIKYVVDSTVHRLITAALIAPALTADECTPRHPASLRQ